MAIVIIGSSGVRHAGRMWRSSLLPAPNASTSMPAVDLQSMSACAALALLLFVWPLWLDIPLLDPDEGLHASIAQEMLTRGDWITPSFLGQPFFDKPILYFWAQIVSLAALGQHEAAVRLPSLFFGALGALATGLLARDRFGARAGLLAGAMQATMLGPLAQSQAGGHDVALVPWSTFALLWLWRADDAATLDHAGLMMTRPAMRRLALTSLFLGLSILTKGLAGVALVMVPAVAVLVAERRLTARRLASLAGCVSVAIVIALPWYLMMEHAHPGYLRYYFVERHLLGFAAGSARHAGRPWWYYVPVLLACGFPWVLYLPAATSVAWPRAIARSAPTSRSSRSMAARWAGRNADSVEEQTEGAAARRVWIWLITGLVFLTVARVKLWTYTLPLFPAIAILSAHAWTRAQDESRSNVPRGMTWSVATHGLIGALLIPAAWLFSRRYGLSSSITLGFVAAGIAFGYAWALTRFARGGGRAAPLALVSMLGATFVTAMTLVMPTVAGSMSARDLSRHVNRRGKLPARMLILDDRIGSFVFYLRPELRLGLTPARLISIPLPALTQEIGITAPGTMLAVRERRAWLIERAFPSCQAAARAGQFRLYRVEQLRACGD